MEIEAALWRSRRDWPVDLDKWRWPESAFVVRPRKTRHYVNLAGIKFAEPDLKKLVGISPRQGIGGAPKQWEKWEVAWFALIRLAQAGELPPQKMPTREELVEKIKRICPEIALSGDTLLPWAGRVLARLRGDDHA